MIAADADILASVPARTALTQDNVARNGDLAAEQFHAEALGF
jgi:hypothetical protein